MAPEAAVMTQRRPRAYPENYDILLRKGGSKLTGDAVVRDLQKSMNSFYGDMMAGRAPDFEAAGVPADFAQMLTKALSVGGLTGFGSMQPIVLENLDSTMTSVLFEQDHLKLFQSVPRVPSIQPLFLWIRRDRYGSHRGQIGFPEGGIPKGGTSKWTRNQATVRYMGTQGGYTHQAMVTGQMGGSFEDPVTSENRNRTLELLEKLERGFLWADSGITDDAGNTVMFDGLVKQMAASSVASTNVIDMQGQPMTFEKLEDIGEQYVTRGKLLNFARLRSFWTPFIISDLGKLKYQAERIALGTTVPDGYRTGVPLDGHQTQRGYIPFEDSIFMDPVEDGKPIGTAEAGAPTRPGTVTTSPGSDATSLIPSGTYYYFASALNDAGESDFRASSAQVVTIGQKVTVTIARATCNGYRLYRGLASDGSDAGWIATVAQPGSGDATYDDKNQWIPNTGRGLVMHVNEPDIAFAQMSPMIKWPLAVTDTTLKFILMLYGVLVVKAAERIFFVKNVGRRT